MLTFVFLILGILVFVIGIIFVVIKRGKEFALLVKDGIEIEGKVIEKGKTSNKRSTNSLFLKYEYRGADGKIHSHRSLVSQGLYSAYELNGSIPIIVSQSRPEISAPAKLVNEAKKAIK